MADVEGVARRRRTRWRRTAAILASLLLVLWAAQLVAIHAATSTGGPLARWDAYWRLRSAYRPALSVVDGLAHSAADVAESDVLRPDGGTFHPLSRGGATRSFVAASAAYAAVGAIVIVGSIRAIAILRK